MGTVSIVLRRVCFVTVVPFKVICYVWYIFDLGILYQIFCWSFRIGGRRYDLNVS